MSQEKTVLGTHVVKQWKTAAGFTAVVIMCRGRHHCGYVGLPKDHLLHGLDYNTSSPYIKNVIEEESVGQRSVLSLLCIEGKETAPVIAYDVHGSITWSGYLKGFPEADEFLWFFGFDCAHCDDGVSQQYADWCAENNCPCFESTEGFKDLAFCEQQCESLAQQIVDKLAVPAIGVEQ